MPNTLNQTRIATLHPRLQSKANNFVAQCAAAGVAVLITQGLRTWAEQAALYAQGRTTPGKIVTNAQAGDSFHNYGLAFDCVPLTALGKADWDISHPDWHTVATIGKSCGLEWGGDWISFKDFPHFQDVHGLTIATCKLYYKQGGIEAVWHHIP